MTADANADAQPVSAWAYWPTWIGALELVVRASRAVAEGADTLGAAPSGFRIAVTVWPGGDIEAFDSPENFKDNVTQSAVRHFSRIDVVAGDDDHVVSVSFVKGAPSAHDEPLASPWLTRGVLVDVRAGSGEAKSAISVCERIARVMNRGWSQSRTTGYTRSADTPKSAVERILSERARTKRSLRAWHAVMAPLLLITACALLNRVFGNFPFHRSPTGDYLVGMWFLVLLALAPVVGWFVSAPMTKWATSSWRAVVIRERWFLGWGLVEGFAGKIVAGVSGAVAALIAAYLLLKAGIKSK